MHFLPNGVEFDISETVNSLNLATIERATLQLRRAVMKNRARLAHQKPAPREAGWDNSHEKVEERKVTNVAA